MPSGWNRSGAKQLAGTITLPRLLDIVKEIKSIILLFVVVVVLVARLLLLSLENPNMLRDWVEVQAPYDSLDPVSHVQVTAELSLNCH